MIGRDSTNSSMGFELLGLNIGMLCMSVVLGLFSQLGAALFVCRYMAPCCVRQPGCVKSI
jgi:hypothetical protein